MRTLLIGDIHGCYRELRDLLDRAGLGSEDRIVAVGDIVDRGPDTPGVLRFFRSERRAQALMGNHERKHVRSFRGEIRPALSQLLSRTQLGGDYPRTCAYFESMPRYLALDEAIVVHGFWEPGVPLDEQQESVLVGTMTAEKYLRELCDGPWYEHYHGDRPLVVGHHHYLGNGKPMVHKDRVFAIDTGCCRGFALTGLLLPEFRFVSVRSRKDYWSEAKQSAEAVRHRNVPLLKQFLAGQLQAPDDALGWDVIEKILAASVGATGLPPHAERRVATLRARVEQAGHRIDQLVSHVAGEHEHVRRDLLVERPDLDAMGQKEQARAYAKVVGKGPLARFVHLARRGKLDRAALKKTWPSPRKALAAIERLLGAEGDEAGNGPVLES